MKKKQLSIIKWSIVIVLFLMSMASGIGLYVHEKDKFASSVAQTDTITISKSLTNKRDSLKESTKKLDKQIKDIAVRIKKIETELKGNPRDSVKLEAELDSLNKIDIKPQIKLLQNQKAELSKLESQIKKESEGTKSAKSKALKTSQYKPSLGTIIRFTCTLILFTLFIISFVLFSGILKLLKSKKMNQNTDNSSHVAQEDGKNVPENTNVEVVDETDLGIEFELPKPSLSYEIKSQDKQSCKIEIKCNRDDAKIYYCFSSNRKDVHIYNGSICVNDICQILAKARCEKEDSQQVVIDVNPSKEYETKEKHKQESTGIDSLSEKDKPVSTNVDDTAKDEREAAKVKTTSNATRVFTNQPNIIGISYQGDNHVKQTPPIPCQDCHSFTKVNDIWSVAVVSDGAGSKKHSDIGSKAVCAAFTFYISQMLKTDKRFKDGDIPNEKIWDLEFRSLLNRFQEDLQTAEQFKSYGFESLAATIIILAYSPKGYLFAHVGDGRAGVKQNGEWTTILTPHKGEEANQTIFSTTIVFVKKPTLMMSGVFVPETSVSNKPIEAFVLMSDGCEDGAWATYQRVNLPNGDFKVEDVNQPRAQTLDDLMEIIDTDNKEQEKNLIEFITTYNKGFKTEGDDKTILIGRVK